MAATATTRDVGAYGRWLKRVLWSPPAVAILTELGVGTWLSGGCAVLALALKKVFGQRAELMVIRAGRNGTGGADQVEHVLVQVDGRYYLDGDGASAESTLLNRWRKVEKLPKSRVVPVVRSAELWDTGFYQDEESVAELVKVLGGEAATANPIYEKGLGRDKAVARAYASGPEDPWGGSSTSDEDGSGLTFFGFSKPDGTLVYGDPKADELEHYDLSMHLNHVGWESLDFGYDLIRKGWILFRVWPEDLHAKIHGLNTPSGHKRVVKLLKQLVVRSKLFKRLEVFLLNPATTGEEGSWLTATSMGEMERKLVHQQTKTNPGIIQRFAGGVMGKGEWVLPVEEHLERVRQAMVARGLHRAGVPLEPAIEDALRAQHAEAVEVYRRGGPESVDEWVKGVTGGGRHGNPVGMTPDEVVDHAQDIIAESESSMEDFVFRSLHEDEKPKVGSTMRPSREWDDGTVVHKSGGQVKLPGTAGFHILSNRYSDVRAALDESLKYHIGHAVRVALLGGSYVSGADMPEHLAVALKHAKVLAVYMAVVGHENPRRGNPIDVITLLGAGVIAGAVQGIVEPYVTKHVYGKRALGAGVGTVANPKPVSSMLASEINRALDKLEAEDSRLTSEMIGAGRGNERPSEYLQMTDPLSMQLRDNYKRRSELYRERDRRYGPGAPSRLPRGFGRVGNPYPDWEQRHEPIALARKTVDKLLAEGLVSDDGARIVEMMMRRRSMSESEVFDIVSEAGVSGVPASGKAIASVYSERQAAPEAKELADRLSDYRMEHMGDDFMPGGKYYKERKGNPAKLTHARKEEVWNAVAQYKQRGFHDWERAFNDWAYRQKLEQGFSAGTPVEEYTKFNAQMELCRVEWRKEFLGVSNPYGEPTFHKGRRMWSGQMGGMYGTKAEAIEAARQFATEIMAWDGQPRDEVTIWTTGGGKQEMFTVGMDHGKRGSHAA